MSVWLSDQCPALISPLERFCHGTVVVFDKSQNLAFEIIHRSEITSFEDFSNEDTEPNFDLVHPGSMFGRVMKNDAMCWVAQKGSPRSLGFQNTQFAFHTQVDSKV